jgi:elongation factor P hydroxylase
MPSLEAIFWANYLNRVSCDAIWTDFEADPGQDYAGQYHTKVAGYVDEQIAKAVYRLAYTLNLVFQCN